MKKIAFVFTQAPHGNAGGREGLDAALATSAFSDDIGLFFLSDGVFQLLPDQLPNTILARNYIATFGVLPLYDVNACFICLESMRERGITDEQLLIVEVERLDAVAFQQQLSAYDVVLTF